MRVLDGETTLKLCNIAQVNIHEFRRQRILFIHWSPSISSAASCGDSEMITNVKKSKFVWSESRNVSWTLKKVVFLNKKKRITKLEKTNTTSHMSIWRSICFEPLLFPVTWLLDQYYWGINSMATQFIRVWTGLGSLFKRLTSSGLLRFYVCFIVN